MLILVPTIVNINDDVKHSKFSTCVRESIELKHSFSESTSKPMSLFPKIGEVAEKTEALTAQDGVSTEVRDAGADDERPVQEIESLCMNCEQNVCTRSTNFEF